VPIGADSISPGERGLGDDAEPSEHMVIPELGAGEHERQLADARRARAGPLRSPDGRELLDAGTAGGEQRELGGHEEPVGREEDDGEEQGGRRAHCRPPRPARRAAW
jgi:hypothetical protein